VELSQETRSCGDSIERAGGIVLCGGRSSRMGTPKHLLPFGERRTDCQSVPQRTMLQVVVETLRSVVSPVVVVRAVGQELPELPPDVLLAEDEEPELGPLAGLCAGMAALIDQSFSRDSEALRRGARRGSRIDAALLSEDSESRLNGLEAVFLASCDAPLLKPEVASFLIEARGERDAAVVRDGAFCHVLAAVYSVRLLPRIREMLRERNLSLKGLLEASDTRIVAADEIRRLDPDLRSFRNANTAEEYAEILRIAGFMP
jgi:molybdenum cofactor guanylyltransferase